MNNLHPIFETILKPYKMSILNCNICGKFFDCDNDETSENPINGELICEKCSEVVFSNIEDNELLEVCLEIFDKINIADYSMELYKKTKKIIYKELLKNE